VLHSKLIGYEILRRVRREDVPPDVQFNPRTHRAVLGALCRRYLAPPGIDVLELGLIDTAGRFDLLPIGFDDRPLWDEAIHLLVTNDQAERQVDILLRSYRALVALLPEASVLHANATEWARRDATHPVFGVLRHEMIEVWRLMRNGTEPLGEPEFNVLHASVGQRVAARIRERLV
jgi:hypothetical protein